jgi:hypothetical protein
MVDSKWKIEPKRDSPYAEQAGKKNKEDGDGTSCSENDHLRQKLFADADA